MKKGTIIYILFVFSLILTIVFGLSYENKKEKQTNTPSSNQQEPTQLLESDPGQVLGEEPTPTSIQLEDITNYEEGQYKVGTDIPVGEYVLLATDNSGYFSVSSDANGSDILFNDNFETNSIITVKKNEYLKLSRCIALPAIEYYKYFVINTERYGTMLKVGKDIKPGEYKLETNGSSGYYCIYDNSRHGDIVANDNFDNSCYVSVESGQYIILSNCRIIQ